MRWLTKRGDELRKGIFMAAEEVSIVRDGGGQFS
jgi:hypothetical protein